MDSMRLLELPPSRLIRLRGAALRQAIAASEGRVLAAEVVVTAPPLVDGVTNAELAAAFGADLILANVYDVDHPRVAGLPGWDDASSSLPAWALPSPQTPAPGSGERAPGGPGGPGAGRAAASGGGNGGDAGTGQDPVHRHGAVPGAVAGAAGTPAGPLDALARLSGRVVGVNLEPSDRVPPGRRATPENARRAVEQGARWILLTGNPHTGVTVEGIERAAAAIRAVLGPDEVLLAAGRMHGAGAWQGQEPFVDEAALRRLVAAGVDMIALPAPATVPGVTVDRARAWVEAAHAAGALAMSTIGTSQEGADEDTLRQIALMAKACGFDVHHIGDAGYHGVALPENILAYGVAIRGRRHTYRRMALSAWRE